MAAKRNRARRGSETPRAPRRSPGLPAIAVDRGRANPSWLAGHAPLVVVLIVVAAVALIRLRLGDVPLERDEGEYAYAGQLILRGIPPYELAYNMKFPGAYYAYAAMLAVFGESPWGIRAGLACVNAVTSLLLFALGRRLLGATAGAVAAVTFAVMSLDRWTMGPFAHATHFVVLPVVAGLLVLRGGLASGRRAEFLAAGCLFGVAVLMKQHAVVFVPLALALAVRGRGGAGGSRRSTMAGAVWLIAGAAIPVAVMTMLFAWQGMLGRFWFWTFQYAGEYVSQISLAEGRDLLAFGWGEVTRATGMFWIAGGAGLVLLWLTRWPTDVRLTLTALLAASVVAISPGLYFRPHYFILLLPAIGLLAGVAVASVERLSARALSPGLARAMTFLLVAAAVTHYGVREWRYLFVMDGAAVSRSVYDVNPFVEAPVIARYIRERTGPDDRIAVLGSEPEIYFYADRKSATGYIYTYPLMEAQPYASRMQDEMMREIEAAHPAYVVIVIVPGSWSGQATSDERILIWMDRYTTNCYTKVGIADIHSRSQTTWRWDAAVTGYVPRSPHVVHTYRRTSDAPCRVNPARAADRLPIGGESARQDVGAQPRARDDLRAYASSVLLPSSLAADIKR